MCVLYYRSKIGLSFRNYDFKSKRFIYNLTKSSARCFLDQYHDQRKLKKYKGDF